MALSEIDRNLLDRCLQQKPRAWEDFVDRFIGLITHVIRHTTQNISDQLTNDDYGEFCNEIFLTILKNDYAVLRHFKGESSLATYLTVVARRRMIQLLTKRRRKEEVLPGDVPDGSDVLQYLYNADEVNAILRELPAAEAQVVREFYLEQKTYSQISSELGIPENSIGPMLHRARERMRNLKKDAAEKS